MKTKSHQIVNKSNHFWYFLDQSEYKSSLGNDFIKKVKAPYWIDMNMYPNQLTEIKGQMCEEITACIKEFQYKYLSFCLKYVLYILTHLILRIHCWEA